MTENTDNPLPETVVPHSPESPGRNRLLAGAQLVFGIVALQNSFITREQLVAAFDAWVHDKSRSLADLLVANGALTAADRELLDRLVAKFLEKHAGDAEASLAALSSVAEVRPQLEQLGDPDLAASLGHVGQDGSHDQTITMIRTTDGSRGRFRIVRPHAKGGLGQVSVALDTELNREVALKEILPQHADNPSSRERFVLEAEITGGLEHPGIVPVYALGQAPDGRPFYAMRFIKGDSLKTAIEAYHHPDNPNRKDPGARQLELRQLLGRFIDVCNAMEYAHSRGVLHRDLKPGNIMVGKYGETLVVDWGLAKAVGKKDIESDEASLKPTTALSGSGQTQPGSAVGTPAYMSPEQARGELDHLGRHSDVYSLGATLYHLLCGQPPFEKEALGELLAKVDQGRFPKPRTIRLDIPGPLESICLKAMSRLAAERYPTAKALADDVEHWLADERITAHTESFSSHVARWSRKHRGLVQAGSIAMVLLLIIATTAAVLINEQRKQTAKLAQEKGSLAERNQQLFESEKTAKTLADQRADSLQKALAKSAIDHGLSEYASGHFKNGYAELMRGTRIVDPNDQLAMPYMSLLTDRTLRNGRLLSRTTGELIRSVSSDGTRFIDAISPDASCVLEATTGKRIGRPMQDDGQVDQRWFSPDGQRIVTVSSIWGSKNGTARLWDAATGEPLGKAMRHKDQIVTVAFSPDGTRVATGSRDMTATLWDTRTGELMGEHMHHTSPITQLAFSPDGARLVTGSSYTVTGSSDGWLRIWDATTGRPITDSMPHPGLLCLSHSPTGTQIASGGQDKAVRLWDAMTGKPIGNVMQHEDDVSAIAFSPDGMRIVTGTMTGGKASLWDAATGRPVGAPMQQNDAIVRVLFSHDGTRLATCGFVSLRLWNGLTAQSLSEPMWHGSSLEDVTFSADDTRIVSINGGTAWVWDAVGPSVGVSKAHQHEISAVAFNSDGTRFLTASLDGTAGVWDTETGRRISGPIHHTGLIRCASFSPDSLRIVTGSSDKTSRIWDASTGLPAGEIMRHDNEVWCASFSPDGTRVVTGGSDGTSRLWDATTGEPISKPLLHDRSLLPSPPDVPPMNLSIDSVVWNALFSSDGTRVLTASSDRTARLWDGVTGQPLGEPMRHDNRIYSHFRASISPDGSRVITGSDDATVRLWDGRTGKPIGEPIPHQGQIRHVLFSPDGSRFVTVDGEVHLWDAAAAKGLGEPIRHDGMITCIAFSPDSRRIATGSWDSTARQWDATTGQPLGEVFKNEAWVEELSFSPDGTRIVTGCRDGTVRLWDVSVPNLEQLPREAVLQTLEWWSEVRSDGQGTLERPSRENSDQIRKSIGDPDFLTRFQNTRHERLRTSFHGREARNAELARNWFAAAFHFGKLLSAEAGNTDVQSGFEIANGNLRAERGHFQEAAAAFDRACVLLKSQQRSDYPYLAHSKAVACLSAGDRAGYRAICDELLTTYRDSRDALTANSVAWTVSLAEIPAGQEMVVVDLARLAAQNGGYAASHTLALALCRAGMAAECIETLTEALKSKATPPEPIDWLVLALASAKLNNKADTTKWFEMSQEALPAVPGVDVNWQTNREVKVLLDEVRAAVESDR